VAELRYVLDPDAIDLYRAVGAATHGALDAAVAELEPGMT
jgi:hypothetical protein